MEEKDSVFMCLDVERTSTAKYQTGIDMAAVLWIGITSLILFLIYMFGADLMKVLLRTDNIIIIYSIDLITYIAIEQKLIRIFVFHEREMLDIYIQQKLSSNVNLAPYYDVRPDGFELSRNRTLGLYDKCLYNNGKESIFINLHLGSKYSRGETTKDLNITTYTSAYHILRKKGYRVIKTTYREPNINSSMFDYYDKQILIEENEEFARDFAAIKNHFQSKQSQVYMTTVEVVATTPQQKIDLASDVSSFVQLLNTATYKTVKALRQNEILTFFKTEYGIKVFDVGTILLDTDRKVPIGICKILSVHDKAMGVLKTFAKPASAELVGDDVSAFKTYKFTSTKDTASKKKQSNNDKSVDSSKYKAEKEVIH